MELLFGGLLGGVICWCLIGAWCVGVGIRSGSGRGGLGRDQNFTQANKLRVLHLLFVFIVKLLRFIFIDSEMPTDFLADHFSRDDLVALCLLEVFPGYALLFGFFLKSFHGVELHVFTHLIELLDQVGIGGDVEVFTFVQ